MANHTQLKNIPAAKKLVTADQGADIPIPTSPEQIIIGANGGKYDSKHIKQLVDNGFVSSPEDENNYDKQMRAYASSDPSDDDLAIPMPDYGVCRDRTKKKWVVQITPNNGIKFEIVVVGGTYSQAKRLVDELIIFLQQNYPEYEHPLLNPSLKGALTKAGFPTPLMRNFKVTIRDAKSSIKPSKEALQEARELVDIKQIVGQSNSLFE